MIRFNASLSALALVLTVVGCSHEERAASGPASVAPPPSQSASASTPGTAQEPTVNIFHAPIHKLGGGETTLAEHEGKALLIVNVASKCGFTPQYAGLEALYEKYKGRGLVVLGFPCNQFGGQEPGSAEDIQSFCQANYGVTFPMYEKIEVNGAGRHPIYDALTKVADASGEAGDVKWNFEKFVVSADGKTVTRFRSQTTPEDPALIQAIEAALP